jgi:perosamine synthetase
VSGLLDPEAGASGLPDLESAAAGLPDPDSAAAGLPDPDSAAAGLPDPESGPAGPDSAIPLARPVIGEREEELVIEVLRSGQLSLGPRAPAFEAAFAARVGARHGSAVSSGTAGLHLALRAVGVGEGDEVITTPFSFVASANVAIYERARPVFADIDPVTLNIDPDAAAAAVSERSAAILPVHVFGYPADMTALERLHLPIVEDACEALGGVYADGGPIGGRGHAAVFAFYANKQITTGEGGLVVTGSAAHKQQIDSERNQGRAPNMDWLDHDRLGFNYRLSDLACALGLAQLERLETLLAARARVAALYREALEEVDGLTLPCEDVGLARRGWFVFVVQLPRGVDKERTMKSLAAQGVAAKPYFPAIHLMSYYRDKFGHREGEFPVCEDVSARSIALPFFPQMTEGQVERVASTLTRVLQRGALASRA